MSAERHGQNEAATDDMPWAEVTPDAARRLLDRRRGGLRRARLPRDDDPGHRGPRRHEPGRALHPLQDQGRAAPPDQPDRPRQGPGDPADGGRRARAAPPSGSPTPCGPSSAGTPGTHTTARVVQYELDSLGEEPGPRSWPCAAQSDATVRGIIHDGVTAGEFDVPDVPGTTLAVLSLCIDVARWFNVDGPRTPDEVGALYADLVLRMVGVPGPPRAPEELRSSSGTPTRRRTPACRRPRAPR